MDGQNQCVPISINHTNQLHQSNTSNGVSTTAPITILNRDQTTCNGSSLIPSINMNLFEVNADEVAESESSLTPSGLLYYYNDLIVCQFIDDDFILNMNI